MAHLTFQPIFVQQQLTKKSCGTRLPSLVVLLTAMTLVACGKSERTPTTAERLGSVKELQETQADFYLPHKSVDYLTDLKAGREAPAKAPEAAPVAVKPATPEATKAVVAAPAPAPVVVAPAPAPVVVAAAPKVEEPREVIRIPPIRDTSQVCKPPDYPATSLRLEETGTVAIRFLIDATGNVINSEITTSSSHPRLDEAAREALSRCKYKPGTADGRPEQASTGVRYTFRLN